MEVNAYTSGIWIVFRRELEKNVLFKSCADRPPHEPTTLFSVTATVFPAVLLDICIRISKNKVNTLTLHKI